MRYVDHTSSPPDTRALFELLNTGRIFTAVFEKRTDGSIRKMNARTGVKKYLKAGGSLKFSPFERGLLPVFDVQVREGNGYRFINVPELISITVDDTMIYFRDMPEDLKAKAKSGS